MFIFYSRHQVTLSFSWSDLNNLFFVEYSPIPTEDTVTHFNELRQDIVLLYELKIALATCDYELESLKHRFETLAPGKVCYFILKWKLEKKFVNVILVMSKIGGNLFTSMHNVQSLYQM